MLLAITAAVVVVLFLGELAYSWFSGRRLYGLADTFTNVSATAFEQIFALTVAVPVYLLYTEVYKHRVVEAMPKWLGTFLAIVLLDLCFYGWHRLSHRMLIMWWGHAPHHSSEEFNVSVALRASGWALLTQRIFYLPIALLGVPVEALVLADALSNLYTLFVHNRVIPKLGVVERVMITPSHHRVHHARNPEYLDKNFGATFLVWDRLFGTAAVEEAPPVFGLRHPVASHNVGWIRFHILFEIVDRMRRARGLGQKLLTPLRPPEWDPAGLHDVSTPAVESQRFAAKARGPLLIYALAQHVVLFLGVAAFIVFAGRLSTAESLAAAAWLWASLVVVGGLLDNRLRWAVPAEVVRWATLGAVVGARFLA